jgi:hypothetical protein
MAQAVAQRHLQDGVDPVPCPPYENDDPGHPPAWNEALVEATHTPQDRAIIAELFHRNQGKLTHPIFTTAGMRRLPRAIAAYRALPQSYRDRIWRKEVDDIVANEKDNLLAPDSDFLPRREMTDLIWADVFACETMCKGGCPWKEECETFYDVRKPRWDKQIEHGKICRQRQIEEEANRRGDEATQRRRATLSAKKAALKEQLKAEKRLSRQLYEPSTDFQGSDVIIAAIQEFIRANEGSHHLAILRSVMSQFPISLPALTFLDFQCLIADYFHDGLPGFRITSTVDPKISGIRVHDSKVIRIGKESHQAFMHQFITHILTRPIPRIQTIIKGLTPQQQTLKNVPEGTPANAVLQEWRESIGLQGRIEDSIEPYIRPRIPLDTYENNKRFSINEVISAGDAIIPYLAYLESGKRHLTLYIKKEEIAALTQDATRILLVFLLMVLFGPSYEEKLVNNPALFTFDAHKGHMNRILAKAMLQHAIRLVTPYNVADSAMTERFAVVDPDEEYLISEIAQEEEEEDEMQDADVVEKNRKAKEEAEINEDEKEDEDDEYSAAQQGGTRFVFPPSRTGSVVSDTNMMFDDNWLIYYRNTGFTQQTPFMFSMNLVDAGLHQFIERRRIQIPTSMYTVEAPFDNGITRGPSLNYLMLGLLRGKNSNVFNRNFRTSEELYEVLCDVYPRIKEDRFIKKLLPIYTIPASPQSLPLFQHIARAPLFAYHMMYDLQHQLSALPSRIKWAGDREQYMVLKGVTNGVFVTLDTTGYYCARANEVISILERKNSIKLVGAPHTLDEMARIKILARNALIEKEKRQAQHSRQKGKRQSDEQSLSKKMAKPNPPITLSSDRYTQGNVSMGTSTAKSKPKGKRKGGANGNHTHKNSSQKHPEIVLDREYFFLNWLYPLTMFVNAAFHKHHAEHAYVLLQDLQKDLSRPFLFSALHEQLIHAVSQIPDVPKKLLVSVKDITADTYTSVAPQCASLLKGLYMTPSSIFSDPIRAKTIIDYLVPMKQRLLKRYPYQDSTANLLHALLTQGNETACLALSLLFERLHGRIQNGTSYLGQILGITGGEILKRVDDQKAWEHLTTVMEKDMQQIKALMKASAEIPTETPAETPAMMPSNPKMIRYSAKKHNVVRGPVYDKLKKDLRQLRSNRVRAMPMPLAAAVAGGSLRKTRHATRRAKKGSRQQAKTRHATRHANTRRRND